MRRVRSYGENFTGSATQHSPHEEVGLLFGCFNANISNMVLKSLVKSNKQEKEYNYKDSLSKREIEILKLLITALFFSVGSDRAFTFLIICLSNSNDKAK